MNLLERVASLTPTFFQKLRNIGLALAAISAAIIAAPVALPNDRHNDRRISRCSRNRTERRESGYQTRG